MCEVQMVKKMRGDSKMQRGPSSNVPEAAVGGVDWGACVLRDGTKEGLNGHYVFKRRRRALL